MLRSVNVGGRNRLAMDDLRGVASTLGYRDVATYVQSGNLVFTASGSSAAVARAIEQRLAVDFDLSVPVIVRSRSQMRSVLRGNPFAHLEVDAKTIHVTFLADRPEAEGVVQLEASAGRFGHDRLAVVGSDVYLHCPGGYGETKLNNAFLERRLGVTATTRNWRTVTTLAEMAGP
jgi:uncharacterized protein (DUF1697 family)